MTKDLYKKISEDEEIVVNDTRYVPIYSRYENGRTVHYVYLTKPIADVHKYDEFCYILRHEVAEDDLVHIYLTTPGGYVDTIQCILDAMFECKAEITVELSGRVASAGTMVPMMADNIIVNEFASMMIHNYRGGYYGAGHEIEKDFMFTNPHLKSFFKSVYVPFLTEVECDNVLEGKDLYLGANEIQERWEQVLAEREQVLAPLALEEIKAEIAALQAKALDLQAFTSEPEQLSGS